MGLRRRVSPSEVEAIIRGDIFNLERNKGFMTVDEFLRDKNHIYGKLDLVAELQIVAEDQIARFLQRLDTIRYF